jgi:hypothetical protein
VTENNSVLQDWVHWVPMMQQSVLMTAVRGPDGLTKYHPTKYLLRWYRRCIMKAAMEKTVLDTPFDPRGVSFTGPSITDPKFLYGMSGERPSHCPRCDSPDPGRHPAVQYEGEVQVCPHIWHGWEGAMDLIVDEYLQVLDEVPHHFQLHFMHAAEIIGYQHPDEKIRSWWNKLYVRLAHDMHLWPESAEQMNQRLGDDREAWKKRADPATLA